MFVFKKKILNRDALQRILHYWPFEWRDSDNSRLWRHKLYLVTSQIQRGRLYDSATWPPSLEQPSSDHHQRGQLFCERRCLFVIFCYCCYSCRCFCCCCCCCCNSIICADLRGTALAPLVPASPPPATPKTHSASWPRPRRSTGRDVRSLVGCHPKETQHCCRVTWVVFTDACSDSTNAGHHLLCPLLTTVLAKSRMESEWVSAFPPSALPPSALPPPPSHPYAPIPESRPSLCPSTSPPMWLSDVEGFDQNCVRQGRKQEHRDRSPRLRGGHRSKYIYISF